MSSRVSAFVIWALVAATAVFWGLRQFVHGPVAPSFTVPIGETVAVRGDLTRLLGAAPVAAVAAAAPQPAAADRFRLVGVMAPRTSAAGSNKGGHNEAAFGVAVISIDGRPARAYRVGASLENDLVLRSVATRSVAIGSSSATSFTLELPTRIAAATGSLPQLSMATGNVNAAPMAGMPVAPPPMRGVPGAPITPGGDQLFMPPGVGAKGNQSMQSAPPADEQVQPGDVAPDQPANFPPMDPQQPDNIPQEPTQLDQNGMPVR